jgi:2-phosphosulfolactate phosphatase
MRVGHLKVDLEMKINIKRGIHGARCARGIGIIIDVFRGSSTLVALLARGARYVIPVKSLSEARNLKKVNPNHLLVGERKGEVPRNFDYGNSPYEISLIHLEGKNVVFRSSAASRGIVEAQSRAEISELLIGSFLNAGSIVDYIKESLPEEITLIAMGTLGFGMWKKAIEDECCALYIKKLLEEEEIDFSEFKSEILKSEGAARLLKLGQVNDMEICLKLDLFNGIVPSMRKNEMKIHL